MHPQSIGTANAPRHHVATKKPRTVQRKITGAGQSKNTRTIQPKTGGGWHTIARPDPRKSRGYL
jgi:hypothetical protein